jgi:hypothetical protein
MLNGLQCIECKHFDAAATPAEFRCSAFPDGIPDPILLSKHDHHEPYPGDHGILFEPVDAASDATESLPTES